MTTTKVLVIGLDGATFDLITPLVAAGELPTFAHLLQTGVHGQLHTVPNTDTAPAWSSFATGLNPANHGLFHEISWTSDRRTLRPMRGADRQGAPFWQLASAAGQCVAIINVPFTYPVEAVNGIMVAGIDAPGEDAPHFCHPPDFIAEFQRQHGTYRIDSQITRAIKSGRPDVGLASAYTVAEQHTKALQYAMAQCPWDLAVLVFSIPDELQHFFWQQMITDTGAQRHAIRDGYRFIDQQIQQVLAAAGDDTTLLLMSDHGFGPICATPAYLAEWLSQQGFLHYAAPTQQPLYQRFVRSTYSWMRQHLGEQSKQTLRSLLPGIRNRVETDARFAGIDWARTTAFAGSSPWEIWINTCGRDPHGCVAPGAEYEQVCAEVIAALHQWRDPQSGQPKVRAVYRREEVYNGRYLDLAPDITIAWNPAAAPPAETLSGNFSDFDADHQSEGILLAAGPGIRAGIELSGARLVDLAPTILHLLSVPVPDPMDGRILTELFSAEREVGA